MENTVRNRSIDVLIGSGEFDFESWAETHYEVVSSIEAELSGEQETMLREFIENNHGEGMSGKWEMAKQITDFFEVANHRREWDGEWVEEVESFYKAWIANGPFKKYINVLMVYGNTENETVTARVLVGTTLSVADMTDVNDPKTLTIEAEGVELLDDPCKKLLPGELLEIAQAIRDKVLSETFVEKEEVLILVTCSKCRKSPAPTREKVGPNDLLHKMEPYQTDFVCTHCGHDKCFVESFSLKGTIDDLPF